MGLAHNRVFLDANVPYQRTLRDWFGLLTTDDEPAPFRVYWTDDVLTEALYTLRAKYPYWDGAKISAIGERMRSSWADSYVRDFEVDGTYPGRDAKDAHVHAAALACQAHYLVTNNVSDSPESLDELPTRSTRPMSSSRWLMTSCLGSSTHVSNGRSTTGVADKTT